MVFIAIVVLIGCYFFFKKGKKETNNIAIELPSHWHTLLVSNVLFYKKLNSNNQLYFRKRVFSFLNSVIIESVSFKLTELDKLLVASSAVIPIFNFKNWNYPNISTVILYPDYFNEELDFSKNAEKRIIGGLVGNGRFEDQMILSKKALYHGFSNKTDKGNTGIHEFVHLLDKLDGTIDGVPTLLIKNNNIAPWIDLMHTKMEAINNNVSDIRKYGGTSKEEFFAVVSEYFFERPKLLKRKHPELFEMLEDCFGSKHTA